MGAAERYFDDIASEEIVATEMFSRLMVQVRNRKIDPYRASS